MILLRDTTGVVQKERGHSRRTVLVDISFLRSTLAAFILHYDIGHDFHVIPTRLWHQIIRLKHCQNRDFSPTSHV